MIVLDTNLLIYAHRESDPQHRRSQRIIERCASRGLATTSICILEFASVVTAPQNGKLASTPEKCAGFLNTLTQQTGLIVLAPTLGFERRLLALANDLRVRGRNLHDLAIGLLAKEADADEIWTHDQRFIAPPGLTVRTPLRD